MAEPATVTIASDVNASPADFVIRSPEAGDQGYIASTWVMAYGRGHAVQRYRKRHHPNIAPTVDRILDHATTEGRVAVRADDARAILGWIIFVPAVRPVIHFAYVRRGHRRRGIGAALCIAAGIGRGAPLFYTMRGPDAEALLATHLRAAHLPIADFLEASS